jgi:hypothetical protein
LKIIIAITEGVNDPAFLRWILKSLEFEEFKKKLSDLPEPFNKNMLEKLKKEYSFEESDERVFLELSRPNTLPRLIMHDRNKSTFIFIYISKGSTRTDRIKEIISSNIPSANENNEFITESHKFAYIFFSDADKSYSATEEKLKKEISNYFSIQENVIKQSKAGEVTEINKELITYYIFPKESSVGALEDAVLPIMVNNNPQLFTNINSFIGINYPQKGVNEEEVAYEIRKKKANIGIAGQLFKDTVGSAIYSIIANPDTKLIKKEDIEKSDIGKKVKVVFNKILIQMV